jgi:hypothetical protein
MKELVAREEAERAELERVTAQAKDLEEQVHFVCVCVCVCAYLMLLSLTTSACDDQGLVLADACGAAGKVRLCSHDLD